MMNKKYLKRFIIETKFTIRQLYKTDSLLKEAITLCESFISDYEQKKKGTDNLFEIIELKKLSLKSEERIKEYEKERLKIRKNLDYIGNLILDMNTLYDDFFTLKENIHLISGNTESCKQIIKFYKEEYNKEPKFLDLIVQHGEYQNNKQREKDYVDCERWEMPLFNVILKPMFNRMTENNINIMDAPIFEQLPRYYKDGQGNIIKEKPTVVRKENNITIVRF